VVGRKRIIKTINQVIVNQILDHSIVLLLLGALQFGCLEKPSKKTKPNIIFIYTDNLGYGDVGCFSSNLHHTPNIDKLASEGIKLTSLYSAAGVCTPSRASLMTGCYAQRVDMHLNDNDGWVLFPVAGKGLNPEEVTIADILKTQGYNTAIVGKWHLGDQSEVLPARHGFDYFYGIPYSEDMVAAKNPKWPDVPLMMNESVIEAPVDLTTTTRRYLNEAINFIKENKNDPFFLYFAHNLPGSRSVPVVDDQFRGKSANGAYGDAIEEIDWSVGEILNTVKQLGLEEKTLIVFTSDNGTPKGRAGGSGGGSNAPFSGKGYDTMEGGMRVPGIAAWPGMIPAGTKNNELCTMMDWLPTFAHLAGGEPPRDRIIDGKNIWPLISGAPDAKSPHQVFYYYLMDQLQAVRDERFKLYLPLDNKYDGGNKKVFYGSSLLKLIDLKNDIKEVHDVSEFHPQIVEKLLKEAEKIRQELGDSNQKGKQIRFAKYIDDPKPILKQKNHE
jgi:arylsulfatase A